MSHLGPSQCLSLRFQLQPIVVVVLIHLRVQRCVVLHRELCRPAIVLPQAQDVVETQEGREGDQDEEDDRYRHQLRR